MSTAPAEPATVRDRHAGLAGTRTPHDTARSTQMSLIHEALARARCQELVEEAARERLAVAVLPARREERRSRRAAARARRLADRASAALARAV